MRNDQRYAPVEKTLPDVLPPITSVEALKAYKRIFRHFGSTKFMPVGVIERRMNRAIRTSRTKARRVWVSPRPTKGHHKGWGRLIHDASHYIFRIRHPHARPHDGGHATLEREIAEFVMTQNWFGGKLKPAAAVRPDDAVKLAAIEARIERWISKRDRAERMLTKLTRKATYYSKKIQKNIAVKKTVES